MRLENLLNKPWSSESLSKSYTSSLLHLSPAPEYANGEVVLASLYRKVGSGGPPEQQVPRLGKEFERRVKRGKRTQSEYGISGLTSEDWFDLITGPLRSPKQPNQAASRYLQISPVIPDAALYSLSARQSSNSWDPGKLIAKILMLGSESLENATLLWGNLFDSLKVTNNDELLAKFLDCEFRSWRPNDLFEFFDHPSPLDSKDYFDFIGEFDFPAKQFVSDLPALIRLKPHLTRRQWISMLESLIRLASASHVFWIASLNIQLFEALKKIIAGATPSEVKRDFWTTISSQNFISYGQYSARAIKKYATGYLKSRVGINLLAHLINEKNNTESIRFESIDSIIDDVFNQQSPEITQRFWSYYQKIIESDSRIVQGKKGSASNISEFLRHVLGKRQTSETGLSSYDQGYYLAKRGGGAWEVSMGPVAVLTLVHACTFGKSGSSNIEDLFIHIRKYGIELTVQDITTSSLERTLRALGLVIDSPDAEGGMALLSPFDCLLEGTN